MMEEDPLLEKWCQIARKFENYQLEDIAGASSALIDKAKWQQAYFHSVQVNIAHMFIKLSLDTSGDEIQSIWLQYNFLTNGRLYMSELEAGDEEEPDLVLCFEDGEFLAFYDGQLTLVPGPCKDVRTDILSDSFDRDLAVGALIQQDAPVCSILMDPMYFCGVWNIIKNEVLFKCKIHPLEIGKNISQHDAEYLVDELVNYSKEWLGWKVSENPVQFAFGAKMYWNFECPYGHSILRGNFGEIGQVTVWCPQCQVLQKHAPIHRKLMESVTIPELYKNDPGDSASGKVMRHNDYDGDDEDEIHDNNGSDSHHQKDVPFTEWESYETTPDSDKASTDSAIWMKSPDNDIEIVSDSEKSCIMSSNSIGKTAKTNKRTFDPKEAVAVDNLLKVYPKLQKPISVNLKKLTKTEIERHTCRYTRCNMNIAKRSFNSKWHKMSHCNKQKKSQTKYSQKKGRVSKTNAQQVSKVGMIKAKQNWNVSEKEDDRPGNGEVKADALIKTTSGVFQVDCVTK